MARASIKNNFGRRDGFLSDIVKGDVTVDVPNRTIGPDTPWAEYAPAPAERMTGARSGSGKTLTVK